MPLGDLFKKNYNYKYIDITPIQEKSKQVLLDEKYGDCDLPYIPDNLVMKCPSCSETLYDKELKENSYCCRHCGFHYRLYARKRILQIADEGILEAIDKDLTTLNPLDYPGYEEKIKSYQEKTGNKEAILTGKAKINGKPVIMGVMDSFFMMGSMGSVVGEKVAIAIEKAGAEKLPLIFFTASGGARMQEGILSLMQMAKTSSALKRFSDNGGLYITVLTDPTMGGVTASFAMLGDIILAEPNILVGFAGKRVIEQTIKQKLPKDFQTAEFLLKHGFIDKIVERKDLKNTLSNILLLHKDN